MITVDNKEKEVKNSLKRTIKIEIVIAEIQPLIDKRLTKISKTMKAPGFRPGKVPLTMVCCPFYHLIKVLVDFSTLSMTLCGSLDGPGEKLYILFKRLLPILHFKLQIK